MSFSANVKVRIAQIEEKCEFCNRAQLSAIIRYAGRVKQDGIFIYSENKAVADCAKRLIYENTGIDIIVDYKKNSGLYELWIKEQNMIDNITDLLMINQENYDFLMPFDCCLLSYVRGAFLGGGSISDPNKSYHLEFDCRYEAEADRLCKFLSNINITAKKTYRKGHYIVYLKEYAQIADILGAIGDSSSALEIYGISIEKDVRNTINRQMNCENANMDKVADAYKKHLAAIEKIKKTIGLEKLPPVLKEIAIVRIQYPEDSLKSLGERLENPIGKSGVNHRLNRILQIASEIK